MSWFKRETKDVDETKETKETENEKDNEYVSDFDRKYKVDENGNYKYHDTPEDPIKGRETEKKSDASDDDDMDPDMNRGREIDDDDER